MNPHPLAALAWLVLGAVAGVAFVYWFLLEHWLLFAVLIVTYAVIATLFWQVARKLFHVSTKER